MKSIHKDITDINYLFSQLMTKITDTPPTNNYIAVPPNDVGYLVVVPAASGAPLDLTVGHQHKSFMEGQ